MKVLIINGSPHENGNTSLALKEMKKVFDAEGVISETVRIGSMDVRGCIACRMLSISLHRSLRRLMVS